MSDAAAADAKVDESAEKKPAGKSKLLPIMLVLNTLLLGGVLAAVLLGVGRGGAAAAAGGEAKKEGAAAESEHEKPAEGEHEKPAEGGHGEAGGAAAGPTVRMADFVIHLRNPDVDRFARLSFEIEVGSEADKTSITNNTARIRDQFIGYLSDRTMEELRGSEGLAATKTALAARLKDAVPAARVRAVYVTDFVVQ
jgi:flagellar FliL protein